MNRRWKFVAALGFTILLAISVAGCASTLGPCREYPGATMTIAVCPVDPHSEYLVGGGYINAAGMAAIGGGIGAAATQIPSSLSLAPAR